VGINEQTEQLVIGLIEVAAQQRLRREREIGRP
jgi:hypothetical protein